MFLLFLKFRDLKRLAIVDHLVLLIGFVTLQPSLVATFTHFAQKLFIFPSLRRKISHPPIDSNFSNLYSPS